MIAQQQTDAVLPPPLPGEGAMPLIELDGVAKSFGGVRALRGVHFDLRPGEVHALLGQNGAGKSTLIKVLAGVIHKDQGEIRINGVETEFRSPAASRAAGIAVVYQDLSLVPQMSIADNLYLAREPSLLGLVRRRRMLSEARRFIAEHGLDLDPATPVHSLPFAYRQLTEIAKALSGNVRILVLDEPTSSLSKGEEEILFEAVAQVTRRGVGVIYITHRLSEVFRLSDRVTVLRDGTNVATFRTQDSDIPSLVAAIVGSGGDETRLATVVGLGPHGEQPSAPERVSLGDDDLAKARQARFRVGVALHTAHSDWARQQVAGISAALERIGAELVGVADAGFDSAEQVRQLDAMIAARPDAVIGIPVDGRATADAFRRISAAGIKLVLMDNAPAGLRPGADYACVVSADNFGLGQASAELLAPHVGQGGTVAVIGFGRDFFATEQRAAAFRRWLADHRPDLAIVGTDFADPVDAGRVGADFLAAHPEVDGAFVVWDEPAMAVVEALRARGRALPITTVDLGEAAALELARGGMIKGIAAQRPFEQGRAEADAAALALLDRKPPAWIALPALPVTQDSLLQAYEEVWRTPAPTALAEARMAAPRAAGAVEQPAEAVAPVPLVELQQVRNDRLKGVDLAIRPGEIVGLAGMVGSGRTEILETIFGLRRIASGRILVDGAPTRIRDAADAIRRGIGLVPEDRHLQGLVLAHSIERNMTLPWLDRLNGAGLFRSRAARTRTQAAMADLSIKAPSARTRVQNLSGGNQQKVVFGRWREPGLRLLLLDEPTVGVDVGARQQIYGVVRQVVGESASALVVSSDLAELLLLCDRIAIVVDGRIVTEVGRAGLRNEEHLHQLVQEHQP